MGALSPERSPPSWPCSQPKPAGWRTVTLNIGDPLRITQLRKVVDVIEPHNVVPFFIESELGDEGVAHSEIDGDGGLHTRLE